MIAEFFQRRRNERREHKLAKLRAEIAELQAQCSEERSSFGFAN